MAALAELPQTTRRLLLASDCEDQSEELARILQNAGSVEAISIYDLPDHPASDFAGVIIDIDLTSAATVQRVRSKLIGEAYQSLPRLFVLLTLLANIFRSFLQEAPPNIPKTTFSQFSDCQPCRGHSLSESKWVGARLFIH